MFNEIELYNEIGKKIKEQRKKMGITQEQLADLTHYSDSFIANIESNTFQSFSISALYTIARSLNTTMKNLLPDYIESTKENYILNCEYCKNSVEIPLELAKLITDIEKINEKKLKFTCPKCHKKTM